MKIEPVKEAASVRDVVLDRDFGKTSLSTAIREVLKKAFELVKEAIHGQDFGD